MKRPCRRHPRRRLLTLLAAAAAALLNACAPSQNRDGNAFLAQEFNDVEARPHLLSKWRGQPLVLNFWAPWCPICRRELPVLAATHAQQKDRVQFIGLTVDSVAAIQKWQAKKPVPYPLLVAKSTHLEQAAALCDSVAGLPLTLIIDANGLVQRCYSGFFTQEALTAELAKLSS